MYRKHAELISLEQELDNLSRGEVNSLEAELNTLYDQYKNPTAIQALARKNIIYNAGLLEQKLEMVRERKQDLYDKFGIYDEIKRNESIVEESKIGGYCTCLSAAVFAVIGSLTEGAIRNLGVIGLLTVIIVSISVYKERKTAKTQLKELLNYRKKAEKSGEKYRIELPQAEEAEAMQLPSPQPIELKK